LNLWTHFYSYFQQQCEPVKILVKTNLAANNLINCMMIQNDTFVQRT